MVYKIEETSFMTWRDNNNPNDRTNYAVNFSGNPKRDNRWHSYARSASIIIPENLAEELTSYGIWVGMTKPPKVRNAQDELVEEVEGFTPTYYTKVNLSYNPDFPEDDQPKVYLVTPGTPAMLLTEDNVSIVDQLADANKIEYIDADIKRSYSKKREKWSLYIDVMYVVQKNDQRDSFRDKYQTQQPSNQEETAPF